MRGRMEWCEEVERCVAVAKRRPPDTAPGDVVFLLTPPSPGPSLRGRGGRMDLREYFVVMFFRGAMRY